jgi:RNA recognition motif-containing protein
MFNDKHFPGKESGQKLNVIPYIESKLERPGAGQQGPKNNLFVQGLAPNISEANVRTLFTQFGVVRSILIKPQNAPSLNPFMPPPTSCYVQFETEEAALKAFDLSKDPGS